MSLIAPFPCPICSAPPQRREHLAGGFELCTRCGFAIRLNARGELVGWATTNQSHPRGVWAAALLLLVALTSSNCVAMLSPPTTPSASGDPQRGVLLGDELPDETWVCVPRTLPTAWSRYACMRLGDVRVLLRTRRLAGVPSAPGGDP